MSWVEAAARVAERLGLEVPRGPGSRYRWVESLRFLATRDREAALRFLARNHRVAGRAAKLRLLARFVHITNHVRAYHTQAELLEVASAILDRAGKHRLVVVEAGTAKGASTAKLSLALALSGPGDLHVFDSFRGIPENDEVHRHWDGRTIRFRKGAFTGRLAAVKRLVEKHGAPERCHFYKGWFAETLPGFRLSVDVALLDVDLWSSTRDCLVHLMPRLRPTGVIFSQDGHLETVAGRLGDAVFWRDEVGVTPPRIRGLGRSKLLAIEPG